MSNKWFPSSWDPDKTSLTLKGLVPLILMVVKMTTNTDLTQSGVEDIIDNVLVAITAAVTVYGLVRKLFKP